METTVFVVIEAMSDSVSGVEARRRPFMTELGAQLWAAREAERLNIDNFDGTSGGGIGYDYRITITTI